MKSNAGCGTRVPAGNKSLGTASLKGYRFREHRYDVRMDGGTFQVFRDDVLLATEHHGGSVSITKQGDSDILNH